MAIAVPGFLEVDINECLEIEDENGGQLARAGGTAHVVKARVSDGRLAEQYNCSKVAVKLFGSNQKLDSFRYEVTLMGALPDSPYLVKILGYCENPMGIIMKYYPLGLDHILALKDKYKDARTRVRMALDIATGMQILHSKGIIHFDLKPG